MRIRDLATAALRLYALFLFFNCIPTLYRLPLHWHFPFGQNDAMDKLVLIDGAISLVFNVVAGILLLRFAPAIAAWTTRDTLDNTAAEIVAPSLVRMSMAIAGVVFMLHGIQLLAYSWSYWYLMPKSGLGSLAISRPELTLEQKARLFESAVTILVGLVLFIGKRRLADIATAARTYGRVPPETTSTRGDEE